MDQIGYTTLNNELILVSQEDVLAGKLPRKIISDKFERLRIDIKNKKQYGYSSSDIAEYKRLGFELTPEELAFVTDLQNAQDKQISEQRKLEAEFVECAKPLCEFLKAHPGFIERWCDYDLRYPNIPDVVASITGNY